MAEGEPRHNFSPFEIVTVLPTDYVINDTSKLLGAYIAGSKDYLVPEITDFLEGHTISYIDLVQRCNMLLHPAEERLESEEKQSTISVTPDMHASYEKAKIIMSSIPEIEWQDIPLPSPILKRTLFAPPKTSADFAWRLFEMRRKIQEIVTGETLPGTWTNIARDLPLLRTVAFFKTGDALPNHLASQFNI